MPGAFIVLEGPDGSGTTLHVKLLGERLAKDGRSVLQTAEPTDGSIGRYIRTILAEKDMRDPDAVQLLFCADRAQHVSSVITPALAAGTTIVSDRYAPSTIAYGEALGLDPDWLADVNAPFPEPDILIFALPPLKVCLERIGRRGVQESLEKREIQERVYAAYERLAAEDPSIIVVDTSGSKEETAERIYRAVLERIPA